MSTIIDPGSAPGARHVAASAPPPRATMPPQRRPPVHRVVGRTGAGVAGEIPGHERRSGGAARRLSLHPGGAGFFAIVAVSLSVLGLFYLVQISRVARAGYTLSNLQEQQAKVERDNDLLQYRINGERTLARAAELAAGEYKMQALNPPIGGVAGGTATAKKATTQTNAPHIRFISLPRPSVVAAPPRQATPSASVFARVRDRLVGVGTARAAGR